jgi:succinate dehydrogenase/fumarate reductase flavoprotein subunit
MQRRLGVAGMPFWREFSCAIFLRFQHLLEKRGTIKPYRVDGATIGLFASNPMQRAAELQEVSDNLRYIQAIAAVFPEEWKMEIDGAATMRAFQEKMRANLIIFRSPEQKEQALTAIQSLMGGQQPEAGVAP